MKLHELILIESKTKVGEIMYHGSPKFDSILKNGFNLDVMSHSHAYGKGVYLTPIKSYAETYGKVVKVKVKVPLNIVTQKEYDNLFSGTEFKKLNDSLLAKYVEKHGLKYTIANRNGGFEKEAKQAIIDKYGIKGFLITDPSYSIGGQATAVVFDPHDIEIIS